MESPSKLPPELAILHNSPALHALKRQQLVSLAKSLSIKANGKNTELIERLRAHGQHLAQLSARDADHSLADSSNASWAIVSPSNVPRTSELAEFGVADHPSPSRLASFAKSTSSSSIASTIRSAGTAVFGKRGATSSVDRSESFASLETAPPAESSTSIYPSLAEALSRYPASPERLDGSICDDSDEDGGIRLVTTRTESSVAPSSDAAEALDDEPVEERQDSGGSALTMTSASPAFVFGSPLAAGPSNFTFTMPGALSLSTASSSSLLSSNLAPYTSASSNSTINATTKSATESVFEELNRRALESRNQAERTGVRLAGPGAGGLSSGWESKTSKSPEKGSREEFDGKHKRAFDKMDSITNHYAAKRPHPSSTNLAQLARSASSSRQLASTTSTGASLDRPTKRTKTNESSARVVSALRDSGWSAAARPETSMSLKASVCGSGPGASHAGSLRSAETGKGKTKALDVDQEREERKRKLELARARRKSSVALGLGLGLGFFG
ncbi:hypothetical protein JCM10212_002376, partial [Sporobolomyces blumeae]